MNIVNIFSQIISSLFLLFLSSSLFADTVLIACDEPSGPRVDISYNSKDDVTSEPEYTTDKYSGVNPIFILNESKPTVHYKWGHSKVLSSPSEEIENILGSPDGEATLLIANSEVLSAIEINAKRTSIFTFYPTLGYGVFTDHVMNNFGNGVKASTFTPKCIFQKYLQ